MVSLVAPPLERLVLGRDDPAGTFFVVSGGASRRG